MLTFLQIKNDINKVIRRGRKEESRTDEKKKTYIFKVEKAT